MAIQHRNGCCRDCYPQNTVQISDGGTRFTICNQLHVFLSINQPNNSESVPDIEIYGLEDAAEQRI